MQTNIIYNENCLDTLHTNNSIDALSIDVILTSPPYNTDRPVLIQEEKTTSGYGTGRYDLHLDGMSNSEYSDFTVKLFEGFDRVLKKDGVVLYNISYGTENTEGMFLAINAILTRTHFTLADTIVWKKKSALPNNVSSNKTTRITEFVFVFCRRSDFDTFHYNKKIISRSKIGQAIYENRYNLVEARNNDGTCPYNKATYSSELCAKLLRMYAPPKAIVYDPFMGSGTTAVACKALGMEYIGSELSPNQVEWANNRIKSTTRSLWG